MLSWNFIMLTHWNNCPRVDTSFNSDISSWFRNNQPLLLLLIAACLAESSKYKVYSFGLIRPGLEPTINHTRGEHTIHNTSYMWLEKHGDQIKHFYKYRYHACLVYSMFPVSLDCSFLIAPSVFSKVYVDIYIYSSANQSLLWTT